METRKSVAIVTGASSEIGKAVAKLLSQKEVLVEVIKSGEHEVHVYDWMNGRKISESN